MSGKVMAFLANIKDKIPAIKEKVNTLKPLFNKPIQTPLEAQTEQVYSSLPMQTKAVEDDSMIKKYGMYAVIGLVLYLMMKKK